MPKEIKTLYNLIIESAVIWVFSIEVSKRSNKKSLYASSYRLWQDIIDTISLLYFLLWYLKTENSDTVSTNIVSTMYDMLPKAICKYILD